MDRKAIVIVSAAPSHAIANVANEIASRGHFTIFAGANTKHSSALEHASNLRRITVDTESPTSLKETSLAAASILMQNGFTRLDVLINDVGVGSPLALLDAMMYESPEEYETKVADALSMYTAFAGLLEICGGKVLNMSSSGAMISAPGMNKVSCFSARRAIVGMSEHMRAEASTNVTIETVMLESVPGATKATPSVILPELSAYSRARVAFRAWGALSSHPLDTLYDLILAEGCDRTPKWFGRGKYYAPSELPAAVMV